MAVPAIAAALALVVVLPHASGQEPSAVVVVDAGIELGPTNQDLVGVGWNTGPLDGVVALRPRQVRIDGSLHNLSVGPGQLDPAELAVLLDRVARVRAAGAEPLVILSYMPPWLARHFGGPDGRDPTKVRPSDYDAWQELVEDVVTELATADDPALRFEVWNEPDIPIFWQDLPDAFIELAVRTHRAVAAVAASMDLELEVGGPAVAFPDPAFIVPYVSRIRSEGLPLDFVSWHYYGNHPLFGPDGAEDILPPEVLPLYPVLGRRNPAATPSSYRFQVEAVRSWVDAALAGSALDPELVIDEWNLSAAGYDLRHDTNEGAAFAAGVLMEMESAGLDGADFYRATDDPAGGSRRGDWGLVDAAGERKPSWWVFHAWQGSAGERLATSRPAAAPAGVFARATRALDTIHVLLSNFDARESRDVSLTVRVTGAACDAVATLRVLDTADGNLASGEPVPVVGGQVDVALPGQSVAWLSFGRCG